MARKIAPAAAAFTNFALDKYLKRVIINTAPFMADIFSGIDGQE